MIKKNVPKDLTQYKTKVFASLTARQLVCVSLATLVILIVYFAICKPFGLSKQTAIYVCMIPGMIPLMFMFSMNDMPLEKYLKTLFKWNIFLPAKRKINHVIYKDDSITEKPKKKKKKNVPDEYKPYL